MRNGLLLRRDIHSLFDAGYVTVTPDFRFEVSRRIKEEFENGRHYYALHGQMINAPEEIGHASRFCSRFRTLLMLKLAIFMRGIRSPTVARMTEPVMRLRDLRTGVTKYSAERFRAPCHCVGRTR